MNTGRGKEGGTGEEGGSQEGEGVRAAVGRGARMDVVGVERCRRRALSAIESARIEQLRSTGFEAR